MPTGLSQDAVAEISGGLRQLLADVCVLYLKTKNYLWHMSGPHFRDYPYYWTNTRRKSLR
jgi:starvation-inducible DNA-binding protein